MTAGLPPSLYDAYRKIHYNQFRGGFRLVKVGPYSVPLPNYKENASKMMKIKTKLQNNVGKEMGHTNSN